MRDGEGAVGSSRGRLSSCEKACAFGSAPGLTRAWNVSQKSSTDVLRGGSAASSWDAGSRRDPYAGRTADISALQPLNAKLEYGGLNQNNYIANIKKWINAVALWLMRFISGQISNAVPICLEPGARGRINDHTYRVSAENEVRTGVFQSCAYGRF